MMKKRDITIGKIAGTHGNRGMLKIMPITDWPDRFLEMKAITLEKDGRQQVYNITEAVPYRSFIMVRLAEVPDMTAAEKLKGSLVKAARDELMDLPAGSFYIFDIVGLKVYTAGGKHVGEIEDVIQTGANDVYVVKRAEGPPVLVPALKSVVREIDLTEGRMVVDYPDCL
jgi:16S rRNA processing protein RimM